MISVVVLGLERPKKTDRYTFSSMDVSSEGYFKILELDFIERQVFFERAAAKTDIVIFNRDITLSETEMEFFEIINTKKYLLFSVGDPSGISISDKILSDFEDVEKAIEHIDKYYYAILTGGINE